MGLITKKPFALTKPVQLLVNGLAPSGLEDSYGRLIDGDHNGQAGGNAIAILSNKGVRIDAVEQVQTQSHPVTTSAAVDALLERGELAGLTNSLAPGALRYETSEANARKKSSSVWVWSGGLIGILEIVTSLSAQ